MRKIITPAFYFEMLEQFTETFDSIGNTLIKTHLSKLKINEEFEFYPLAELYALDVMCGNYLRNQFGDLIIWKNLSSL